MRVAVNRSCASTADRQTDREKHLTKATDYALFETMIRRIKTKHVSAESAIKINFKLRRRIAVEPFEFREGQDTYIWLLQNVYSSSGTNLAAYSAGTEGTLHGEKLRDLKPKSHIHLVPSLVIHGVIIPLVLYAFITCTQERYPTI
jgi:hypothetical protein